MADVPEVVIEVATKQETFARIEIAGPTGSGKTWTSLLIARGLVGPEGKIGVICTENKSARKYSDLTRFFVADLKPPYTPALYRAAIQKFAQLGVDCLVVDSLSHSWAGPGGILEMVDTWTLASKSKNAFTEGWSKATPEQNALMQALAGFPGHLIVTSRVKMAYEVVDGMPKRLGLAPVLRDGVEYEFDVCCDMKDAVLTVWKTRCPALFGFIAQKPGVGFGKTIRDWLTDGTTVIPPRNQPIPVESGLVGFSPFRGLPRSKLSDAELVDVIAFGREKLAGITDHAQSWIPAFRQHLAALEEEQQRRQAMPAKPAPVAEPEGGAPMVPASDAPAEPAPVHEGRRKRGTTKRASRKSAEQPAREPGSEG